ncbi:Phosphatidylinositol N-acetylglucosaminyltransferase subunit P [Psilocybe cubensis]|nr:Phosphatidylinositol N-acetylglucosaminyltransferase subunit P [Psilocybe cubensis]KAH9478565.1 Phosphatidylinositol N-acetylglucosaminyltransferase subunit P [Psilocybe cubensis]
MPPSVPEEPSYVVGFDTPMIFAPEHSNRNVHASSSDLYRVGASSKRLDVRGQSGSLRQQEIPEGRITPSTRVNGYRVRWMPLSVDRQGALRAGHNVADMHAVQDTIQGQDAARKEEENVHQEDMRGRFVEENPTSMRPRLRLDIHSQSDDANDDDMYNDYSDRALLSRPSLLSGQNVPSSHHSPSSFTASRSPTQGVSASTSTMLISSIVDQDTPATQLGPSNRLSMTNLHSRQSCSSLGPSRSTMKSCRCSPPCPGDSSGTVNCRVLGPVYPALTSPSVSIHSFTTSSPGTSTSPINLSSRYGPTGGYELADAYDSHEGIDRRSTTSSASPYDTYGHSYGDDSRPYRVPQDQRLLLLTTTPQERVGLLNDAHMADSPSKVLLDTSPRSPTAPYRWPPEPEEQRSRAPEFYGFVAWTSTYLLFLLYLLWAILPDEWLVWCGVTWYPNREWALLVPSWTVVTVLLTYFVYFALAIRATPAFDEMGSVTDSRIALPSQEPGTRNPYFASAENDAIPELYDIPIGLVNSVLYHDALQRAASKRSWHD